MQGLSLLLLQLVLCDCDKDPGKALFPCLLPGHHPSLREVSELEWEPEENSQSAAPWLVLWLIPRWLAYTTQTHLLVDGATHSGLGPLPFVISQDILSQKWPQANLIWEIPQLRFPLPR